MKNFCTLLCASALVVSVSTSVFAAPPSPEAVCRASKGFAAAEYRRQKAIVDRATAPIRIALAQIQSHIDSNMRTLLAAGIPVGKPLQRAVEEANRAFVRELCKDGHVFTGDAYFKETCEFHNSLSAGRALSFSNDTVHFSIYDERLQSEDLKNIDIDVAFSGTAAEENAQFEKGIKTYYLAPTEAEYVALASAESCPAKVASAGQEPGLDSATATFDAHKKPASKDAVQGSGSGDAEVAASAKI